jgi:hypothetical protein
MYIVISYYPDGSEKPEVEFCTSTTQLITICFDAGKCGKELCIYDIGTFGIPQLLGGKDLRVEHE